MYDQVGVAEITLVNSGKVGFEFVAIGMDPGMASKPKPGVPVMIPHAVSIILIIQIFTYICIVENAWLKLVHESLAEFSILVPLSKPHLNYSNPLSKFLN